MDISIKSKEPLTLYTANKYCKEDITLQVESEELRITPSSEEQVKEGLFDKVIVAGVESSFGKITDVQYLFYNNYRKDEIQDVLKCCVDVTSCERMFDTGTLYSSINLIIFDMSKVTTTWAMFSGCTSLITVIFGDYLIDKITTIGQMFYNCKKLKTVDLSNFDASNVINISNMFYSCSNLENLTSFRNLGKGFAKVANHTDYTLNLSPCTKLTHDSLMSVINNLYDLNLTYDVANGGTLYTQKLVLGSTNIAKLSAEEIRNCYSAKDGLFHRRRRKMKLFNHTRPKMIVSDEGKYIRQIDDVHKEAYIDEQGNGVPEHIPYYSTTIFVPDSFTEEQMNELYVEENIEK